MSSRLKERGGGAGKITASKPLKPQAEGTPEGKGGIRRTPVSSGKENPKSLSGGRVSATRQRPVVEQIKKPMVPAMVRWSTSSMPRGKASNPSDSTRFLSDVQKGDHTHKISGSGQLHKNLAKSDTESVAVGRKSLSGLSVLQRCRQKKLTSDSGLNQKDDKPASGFKLLENGKPNGLLGLDFVKSGSRALGVKPEKNGERFTNVLADVEVGGGKDISETIPKLMGKQATHTIKFIENCTKKRNSAETKSIEKDKNDKFPLEICQDKVKLISSSQTSDKKDSDVSTGLSSLKERKFSVFSSDVTSEKSSDGVMVSLKGGDEGGMDLKGPHENSERGSSVLESSNSVVDPCGKVSDSIILFESLKEPKLPDGKDVRSANKYPSKLREKLSFLEGKVQRIAADIKRTKESLDSHNPDSSKLILHDIQNEIFGIEKAVGQAIDGSKGEFGLSEPYLEDNLESKHIMKGQLEEAVRSKVPTKGLNHKELEARFFPHYRLLRKQPTLGTSEGQDTACKPILTKKNSHAVREDGSLSLIDENPIALEFLASLNADQLKSNTVDAAVLPESIPILEMVSDSNSSSAVPCVSKNLGEHNDDGFSLSANEKLEEFDDQENKPTLILMDESEDPLLNKLFDIGCKSSTCGWFVSEGEAALLTHSDGSCSYNDIANCEVKAEYMPPRGVSKNLWGDCWLIRAPGADGCSGRYVVAASAGNTLESGFCSWDFYSKEIQVFKVEDGATAPLPILSSRTVLGPLPNTDSHRRNALYTNSAMEKQQWWYRPCGPLLLATSSGQSCVNAYDIRDGDLVMTWEAQSPVMAMEYSSPLQWRSRGKVIIAGTEAIALWDVNSINPQPLLSVALAGKKVHALHVNNTDAELGGGVRQRVSSSEAEGNDGVFCTQEGINVFDFRLQSGTGLKITKPGCVGQCIFSRGDSIFLGCTETRSLSKAGSRARIQQFSLRKGKVVATYVLPNTNAHYHHSCLTQVWGNSKFVMGISGLGLSVFDALKDEGILPYTVDHGNTMEVRETIGPDDLYCPSFDYLGSRVLVISKDRPAAWRYLS